MVLDREARPSAVHSTPWLWLDFGTPRAAPVGDGFLIAATSQENEQSAAPAVFALSVDEHGNHSSPPALIGSGRDPDVASDGTDSLIVWIRDGKHLMARRVAAGGAASPPIDHGRGQTAASPPRLVFDESGYVVAWKTIVPYFGCCLEYESFSLRRLTAGGTLIESLGDHLFTARSGFALGGAAGRVVFVHWAKDGLAARIYDFRPPRARAVRR